MNSGLSITIDEQTIGLIACTKPLKALGTGFIFLRPEWVVTAKHVVINPTTGGLRPGIAFSSKGRLFPPKGIVVRPRNGYDVAVLELAEVPPCQVPLYPSYIGLAGDPRGLLSAGYRPSLNQGNVRSIDVSHITSFEVEKREHSFGPEEVIVFDAKNVEPGSSGGPVFSWSGGVAGIIIEGPSIESSGAQQGRARATSIIPLLSEGVL
jgi:S1-C subfamily serine protease